MNRWLIGVTAVVLVAFAGSAQPKAAGQPPAAARSTSEIDEVMQPHAEKGKGITRDKIEREFKVSATAGRRVRADAVVYYVYLRWESVGSYGGNVHLNAADAATVAEFLDKPMSDLPPEAAKGDKALLYRRLEVKDCFDPSRNYLWLTYHPERGELSGPDGFDSKAFGTALRAAIKDLATLKTYPVNQ
jgi:hypothetical protein